MNCFACKKNQRFTCECTNPELFLCDNHLKQHVCEPGTTKNLKNKDLILILAKDLSMINQITIYCYIKIKKLLEN